MTRPLPWFWILLAILLLLLPGPAGQLLRDLLGGLTLTLLLLPLLAGAAGWIGWQVLRSRLRTCSVCGLTSLAADVCPACGSPRDPDPVSGVASGDEAPAGVELRGPVTINVDAIEVKGSSADASSGGQDR